MASQLADVTGGAFLGFADNGAAGFEPGDRHAER